MSGYQGLGHYDTEPPKRPRGPVIAMVVAVVVALGVVTTLLVVRVKDTTPGQALGSAGAPATTTSANDPLQPKSTGAPQVPGWKVIPINDGGRLDTDKAYDVPPTWEAWPRIATFGEDGNTRLVTPALYMRGFCPGAPTAFRSMSGLLVVSPKGNIELTATSAAQQVADAVFTVGRVKPTVEVSEPQRLTVDRNKNGAFVAAKVTAAPSETEKCNTQSAALAVMTLEAKEGADNVAMVAFGDQGVPEATPEAELRQIVTSFHVLT